jgi:uncharacterized protein YjbI with pentapeptide repeats
MNAEDWERGRTPFPLTDGYKDYSGQDLGSHFLAHSNALSHAFLNGVNISDSVFAHARLDHCELAESVVERSTFTEVSLSTTDIVRASVKEVIFDRCDFSNAELRQTRFDAAIFRDCTFSHTTINLCSFSGCQFDGAKPAALDHRSVSYNTFSECVFNQRFSDSLVVSRNFGVPAAIGKSVSTLAGAETTLEHVCLLSSSGQVLAADLAHAVENEFAQPKPRLKKLRLEFISNIVSLMSREGRISAASLVYIEGLFSKLARHAVDETDFLAAMNALVNLRNALYDVATRSQTYRSSDETTCYGVSLTFRSAFDLREAEVFANALSEVVFGRPGDITIVAVRSGSTIVECVFSTIATVGTVLGGINLLVSQVHMLVERVEKLRKRITKLTAPPASRSVDKRTAASRVPAILDPSIAVPELVPLRAVVERDGRLLLLFDEPTTVALVTMLREQGGNRRRKKV